jgi:hypothetical protein
MTYYKPPKNTLKIRYKIMIPHTITLVVFSGFPLYLSIEVTYALRKSIGTKTNNIPIIIIKPPTISLF